MIDPLRELAVLGSIRSLTRPEREYVEQVLLGEIEPLQTLEGLEVELSTIKRNAAKSNHVYRNYEL